jgi:hypothetical protein
MVRASGRVEQVSDGVGDVPLDLLPHPAMTARLAATAAPAHSLIDVTRRS